MHSILGITAEYDPFHKGHAYQLRHARELTEPAAVVCVMSGSFTQRGEPAVMDKWTRARIAAEQGADLVFELPFLYACNRAEGFASGAVDLLAAAGATHISFGCEAQQPEELQRLADLQVREKDRIEGMVREFMKEGCSRAKALEMSCRQLLGDDLTELSLSPNNILALEYLKRIRRREETGAAQVQAVPIQRLASGYNEADAASGYAGGSALRKMLACGMDIKDYLPYDMEGLPLADLPAARQRLYEQVRGILLRSDPKDLARIYCVGEGMEHRLKREAMQQETYEGFLDAMTSRRYTASTIRRIMIYLLMNIEEMPSCRPYGRILAASEAGRRQLRRIEEKGELTVISGRSDLARLTGDEEGNKIRQALRLDALAADMYDLLCGRPLDQFCDARQHPYIGE